MQSSVSSPVRRKISLTFAKHTANPFKPILCALFVLTALSGIFPTSLLHFPANEKSSQQEKTQAREDSTAREDSSRWMPTHFTLDFDGKF